MNKVKSAFLVSSALILIVTALAKFYSASGDVKLLLTPDPLLHIHYGVLLPVVAALELGVAALLFLSRADKLKYLSLLWLSLNFMLYRLGFWFIGLPMEHCKCLGNLTDTLRLDPHVVQAVLQGMVFYLFVGSAIGLLCTMWNARLSEPNLASPNLERRSEANS
jgi:hypothetical protein